MFLPSSMHSWAGFAVVVYSACLRLEFFIPRGAKDYDAADIDIYEDPIDGSMTVFPLASHTYFARLLNEAALNPPRDPLTITTVVMRRLSFQRDDSVEHFRIHILESGPVNGLSCVAKVAVKQKTAGPKLGETISGCFAQISTTRDEARPRKRARHAGPTDEEAGSVNESDLEEPSEVETDIHFPMKIEMTAFFHLCRLCLLFFLCPNRQRHGTAMASSLVRRLSQRTGRNAKNAP